MLLLDSTAAPRKAPGRTSSSCPRQSCEAARLSTTDCSSQQNQRGTAHGTTSLLAVRTASCALGETDIERVRVLGHCHACPAASGTAGHPDARDASRLCEQGDARHLVRHQDPTAVTLFDHSPLHFPHICRPITKALRTHNQEPDARFCHYRSGQRQLRLQHSSEEAPVERTACRSLIRPD